MQRVRRAALLAAWSLSVGVVAVGCGPATRTTWRNGVVERGPFVAELPGIPPTWQRMPMEGAMLAFAPPESRQVVLINSRCGLANDDVPLVSLTQHLLIGTTDRATLREERVPFDGREALRTFIVAKLDGVPRFFDIVITKKNGCVVDFVRTGPPGDEHNGQETFTAITAGYRMRAPEVP